MIVIGSDHGGLDLKEEIVKHLESKNIEINDVGVFTSDSVDYPDIAKIVCDDIKSGKAEKGIIICGTGIGISISANKIKGIRAALCGDCYSARMAKEHNNANVIALGGRILGPNLAAEIIDSWLNAEYQGGRHQRRVDKIHELENND